MTDLGLILTMKKIYFAGSIRGGRLHEQGHDADARIYNQDTAWLRESDLLVAECTCPSLGVGYELAYAEHHGKPVHIFYNRSKCQLSAMLTGDSYFNIHPYETEEEIFVALDKILAE